MVDEEECTKLLIPSHLDGDANIKRDFFDQLTELLCYKKDPSLITSTGLIYSETEATIVVTRNSNTSGKTWSDKDVNMLEYLAVSNFVMAVEALCYSTDFCTMLEASLTAQKLRRVVEELSHTRWPMQVAVSFMDVAQQCPGFRDLKIVLLNSLPPRKVKTWRLPKEELSATPQLERKFRNEVGKLKNVHAEMLLMAYLLDGRDINSETFPYIEVSKKTCLLCGHLLQETGFFETRGNHGKCYSQWTFPKTL